MLEADRPHVSMTWVMRIACCLIKATNTHLEYVILIAFPPQVVAGRRQNVTLYVQCLSCSQRTDVERKYRQIACLRAGQVKHFDSFTDVVGAYVCGLSVGNLTYRTELSGNLLVAPASLRMLTADSVKAYRRGQSEPASLLLQLPGGGGLDDDTDDF
jgi:hypothetical protein